MTTVSQLRPLQIVPGVQPVTDRTPWATQHATAADHVRWNNGLPEKIGGWVSLSYRNDTSVAGVIRMIWSATIQTLSQALIGTNSTLYSLLSDTLTNITPLDTTAIPAANSLANHYATLAADPIATTNASKLVVITDSEAGLFKVGDTVTLSGATTTNGVPNTELNADHIIRAINGSTYTIRVATAATSTGSGGGASVVRTSGLITLTSAAHGQTDGKRVKIDGAATFAGILDTEINQEFIIRNITANTFDFMTDGTASSSASAAGGAATEYYIQIAAGNINASASVGYGAGLYGAGLYGTALVSGSQISYPRLWQADRFGDLMMVTPGNGGGTYVWDGDLEVAPTQIPGAPDEINYLFVSDNILVTLGADGIGNRIKASDQASGPGDGWDTWVSSSTNQAYTDDIEGAGKWMSQAPIIGQNLLFTENQTWRMRYIGLPLVWEVKQVSSTIGIISQNARVSVNGLVYWMGQDNFYMWDGSQVMIIPANTQTECTAKNYVFNNLNKSQQSKCFAWYNKIYEEVWFHYPVGNECMNIVRLGLKDNYSWTTDTMDRTAAEYPVATQYYPRLSDYGTTDSQIYFHENGNDADGEPLSWSLTTCYYTADKKTTNIVGFVPDSYQLGDINVNVSGRKWPQSTALLSNADYTVTPTTEYVNCMNNARYWQYTVSGSALGQYWRAGNWQEDIQLAGFQ